LDEEKPYYRDDAKQMGSSALRKVIKFRLRPVSPSDAYPEEFTEGHPHPNVVKEVPVEEQYTERCFVEPDATPYEVQRREQHLVKEYKTYMAGKGSRVVRHLIRPSAEERPLFTDLYDPQRSNLLEAKGTVTRNNIRMAIGQLCDYGRFLKPGFERAVLLPEKLRKDLEDLLSSQKIAAVWRDGKGGFADNARGRFT
jgi:hypothetical protein